MALFEWTQDYSVSIQRFDSDHKKLISLANELNDAMAAKRGRFVTGHILRELDGYARRHFADEEEAMRQAGYAGLQEHLSEHREIEAKVAKFQEEYLAGSAVVSIYLLYFLRDWLQRHLLETDRKYAEPLRRAGIR